MLVTWFHIHTKTVEQYEAQKFKSFIHFERKGVNIT